MQQNLAHDLDDKLRTKDVILEENVSFASLLLHADIQKGLSSSGFKKPSPIQFKSIPLGRCGFDLVVKSKSGTGKTLVFSTIALEAVNVEKLSTQVLILVPTREIAVQIQDVLRSVGRYVDGLTVESFIGGLPLNEDIKKAQSCHIAVGAPGRVKHLITLGALSTKLVRLFVLDEADKLMESSFQSDINEIYDSLPHRKQVITTSATYPKELDTFLTNYMQSPTHVTSENETPLLLGLRQFVAVLKANTIHAVQQMRAKNEILLEILAKVSFTQCLVFTNYQTRTESVSNFLNQKGWDSSFISAASEQSQRLEAISNLKNFKSRILLSTDLTSRGIDAPNVDLVINYDLPHDAVTYLHRMGRAGRYGSAGICINFALEGAEIAKLQNILGTIGSSNLSISKLPPLNGSDLWQVDVNGLEQIWGVVPSEGSNEISESIKGAVLTLKQKNKNGKVRNKSSNKKGKKKIKLEENCKEQEIEDCKDYNLESENILNSLLSGKFTNGEDCKKRKIEFDKLTNVNSIQQLLKNKKEEIEDSIESSSIDDRITGDDLKPKIEEMNSPSVQKDQGSLLSSLVDTKPRDNLEEMKIKIEETEYLEHKLKHKKEEIDNLSIDTDDLLTSLLNGDDEDTKKRKRGSDSTNELQKDKRTNDATFVKNKCLLSVTKLLYDTSQVDPDVVDSIDDYVTILKDDDIEDNKQKTVEEILGLGTSVKKEEIEDIPKNEAIEEIFKIGYDCAVKKGAKNWLNCLPNEELQKFQDACRSELVAISSDSEVEDEEEAEDYEMEEYDEPGNDVAVQWTPVADSNEARDHFTQCFEDCSNELWQTGLTFETVAGFDDWFYQWQENLQSVRNYVQQNIYVEEMAKYQQSRVSDK